MVINNFFKFFRKYATAILLPITLLFLITVFGLFRSVDNQTQNLNMKTVFHVQSVIDNEIKNFTSFTYRLSNQEEIISFSKKKEMSISDEIMETYNVSRAVSGFITVEKIFSNLGVYSVANDKLVSSSISYSLEEFYNTKLSDTKKDFEAFKNAVCKNSITGYFVSTNDGNKLIYCQPANFGRLGGDLIAISVIDKKAIDNIVSNCTFTDDLYAGMITPEGQLISLNISNVAEGLDTEKISKNTSQYNEDGKSVIYSASKALSGRYVYIFEEKALSGNVKGVIAMFVIMLLAAIGVMLYMSYKNSKEMFSASRKLAENLSREVENTKQQVLVNILKNVFSEYKVLESKYNIVFDKEKICVFCLDSLDDEYDIKQEESVIIREYIDGIMAECFGNKEYNKYVVYLETGKIICIVNYSSEEIFREKIRNFDKKLSVQSNIKFLIGVGNRVENVNNICLSYNAATTALSYARNNDAGSVVWYETIKQFEGEKVFFPEEKAQLLTNYIKNGNVSNVNILFDEIYSENFEERMLSHSAALSLIMRIVVVIQDIINELYSDTPYKRDEFERVSKRVLFSNDFNESFEVLREIGISISKQTEKSEDVDGLKETILKYISDNYSDCDISLNSLSEYMGFSYYYTSRIFREFMGLSFVKYVTIYRLEQSKKMLLETEKSVEDISKDAGFSSSNTFIKIFKKNYCLTPGQFRKTKE